MSGRKWLSFLGIAAALACLTVVFGTCIDDPPPPPTTTEGDVVVNFPGTTSVNWPLLLYSGQLGGSCVEYQPSVADPNVTLDDVSFVATCRVEIDAFAPGFGAWVGSVNPSVAGSETWLANAIASGSLTVSLPAPTPVPLRLWLVGNDAEQETVEAVRKKQLDKAYPVLDVLGSGLTLDTSSAVIGAFPVVPDCAEAAAIKAIPSIYDPSRINVYFVKGYLNNWTASYGYNCWATGDPDLVFISWGNTNLPRTALVHELSHALGLVHPNAAGGHTYNVDGFNNFNLMAGGPDVQDITIGQLYAMNFSSGSWLNRSGSPFVRPVKRDCQDDWETGVCPSLKLIQADWPP